MVVNDDFQKSKMLLSRTTLGGIRTTVYSTIEIVKFLLEIGAPFVLTAKLNQDLVENYFSRQRGCCGSGENLTVNQYGPSTKRLKLMETLMRKVKNGERKESKKEEESSWYNKCILKLSLQSFD